MYYVSYTDHIEDRVHIQIHHYEINQCVGKKKKFFVSSVSYTCTAFIRFPLSKRDSNITVVSSESRIVTAAGRQPSLFPPIRDRINYFFIYKKNDSNEIQHLHNHKFQDNNYKQFDHYSHHNYEQMVHDQ